MTLTQHKLIGRGALSRVFQNAAANCRQNALLDDATDMEEILPESFFAVTEISLENFMARTYAESFASLRELPDAAKEILTSNMYRVTSFKNAFKGCGSLAEICEIDTSAASDLSGMFEGCKALPEKFPWAIDLRNTTTIDGIKDMFKNSSVKVVRFANVSPVILPHLTKEILGGIERIVLFNRMYATRDASENYSYGDTTRNAIHAADMYGAIHIAADVYENLQRAETILTDSAYKLSSLGFANDSALVNTRIATKLIATDEQTTLKEMCKGYQYLTKMMTDGLAGGVNVTDISGMFEGCTRMKIIGAGGTDLAPLKTLANVQNLSRMFYGCTGLTSIDISPFAGMTKVTNISNLFYRCTALTDIDLSPLANMTEVTALGSLFYGCNALTSIDLTPVAGMTKATSLAYLLQNCTGLTTVTWAKPPNVTNTGYLFSGCSNLTTINGVIDMTGIKTYTNMFYGCSKLAGVKIKNPPEDFESSTKLSASQYEIVSD